MDASKHNPSRNNNIIDASHDEHRVSLDDTENFNSHESNSLGISGTQSAPQELSQLGGIEPAMDSYFLNELAQLADTDINNNGQINNTGSQWQHNMMNTLQANNMPSIVMNDYGSSLYNGSQVMHGSARENLPDAMFAYNQAAPTRPVTRSELSWNNSEIQLDQAAYNLVEQGTHQEREVASNYINRANCNIGYAGIDHSDAARSLMCALGSSTAHHYDAGLGTRGMTNSISNTNTLGGAAGNNQSFLPFSQAGPAAATLPFMSSLQNNYHSAMNYINDNTGMFDTRSAENASSVNFNQNMAPADAAPAASMMSNLLNPSALQSSYLQTAAFSSEPSDYAASYQQFDTSTSDHQGGGAIKSDVEAHQQVNASTSDYQDKGALETDDDTPLKLRRKHTKVRAPSKPKFVLKLMEVLSNKECHNAIRWMPAGNAFCIFNAQDFVDNVLAKHFKEAKYSSFTRKLNRWGFKNCTPPSSDKKSIRAIYFHERFHRDHPQWCRDMKAGLGRKHSEKEEQTVKHDVPLQTMSDQFQQSSSFNSQGDINVELGRNHSEQLEQSSSQVSLQNTLTQPDRISGYTLQGDMIANDNNRFQFQNSYPQSMPSFLHGEMMSNSSSLMSSISQSMHSFSTNQLASGQSLLPVISQGQALQGETVPGVLAQSIPQNFVCTGNVASEFTSTNQERRHTWNLDSPESAQEPDSPEEQTFIRKRQNSY